MRAEIPHLFASSRPVRPACRLAVLGRPDNDANARVYGKTLKRKALSSREQPPSAAAQRMIAMLNQKSPKTK